MQFDQINRREFITLVGGAAAAWPFATRAQQAAMPVVGFVRDGSADTSARLAMSSDRSAVVDGGLASLSANFPLLYEYAALYVDKLLKGANPASLPVEQPSKFQVTVNGKTAQALGLSLSPILLAQVDEVIE